jgi:endonuclease YncB( thermonuclease family)
MIMTQKLYNVIPAGKKPAAVFILTALLCLPMNAQAQFYVIEQVVDGNTLKLSEGKKVRLIGIDAPEDSPNAKAREESKRTGQNLEALVQMGRDATAWVKENFKGRKVFLKHDVQEKDTDGTELAYVYLFDELGSFQGLPYNQRITDLKGEWWEGRQQGLFVFLNATIVGSGYAQPAVAAPNDQYADLFTELYEKARQYNRGLWDTDTAAGACKKEGEVIGYCLGCRTECCEHLTAMFPLKSDGQCLESPVPGSAGICSHCGNEVCEGEHKEDHCGCPDDCPR